MLLLVSRQVLVLLMSTTVIMKGAFAEPDLMDTTIEPCLNNEEFRLRQDERTCDWIGEKEARKDHLCLKPNVKNNCPKTCNVHCNLEECPLKEPKRDSSCLEYIDGLSCDYTKAAYTCINGKWNVACPDLKPANGDECFEDMKCDYEYRIIGCPGSDGTCEPTQRFTCNGVNWVEVEGFYSFPPCEDGSNPMGDTCDKRTSC